MSVQPLAFGQKLPSSGTDYLRVKEKGDQVQFRIAQQPVFTGKHFMKTESGWDVTDCLRVTEQEDCEKCEKFFELKALAKQSKDDEKEFKRLDNEARAYSAAIQFYFPILDRGTGKFRILQTTNGVRNKLNVQFLTGIDVMGKEWVLANTGGVGINKYNLAPVDSADVKPFTPDEELEFEKAQKFDLSVIAQPQRGDADADDSLEQDIDKVFPNKNE